MEKHEIDMSKISEPIRQQKPDWSEDGLPQNVYRVPLELLFYNDKNARIATWISGYSDNPSGGDLNALSNEDYNATIADFIKKSDSPSTFKKTLEDIAFKGQIRPGTIMSDGRIVDGNRRFTCLRELHEKNPLIDKYAYFECFIVPSSEDIKTIKKIERMTQFGVDEKVDYNPVEKLVEAYEDMIGPDKFLSVKEYQVMYKMSRSEAEGMLNRATILVDYLDYIKKPLKFQIARFQKLDGPINELARLYKSIGEDQEWNRVHGLFFAYMNKEGDRTRNVRELIKIYNENPSSFEEILNAYEQEQIDQDFAADTSVPSPDVPADTRDMASPKESGAVEEFKAPEVSDNVDDLINKAAVETGNNAARNKPYLRAAQARKALEDIDFEQIAFMSADDKSTLRDELNSLKTTLEKIEADLNK